MASPFRGPSCLDDYISLPAADEEVNRQKDSPTATDHGHGKRRRNESGQREEAGRRHVRYFANSEAVDEVDSVYRERWSKARNGRWTQSSRNAAYFVIVGDSDRSLDGELSGE